MNKTEKNNIQITDSYSFYVMIYLFFVYFQAQVLSSLSHRNIIKFYGAVIDEPNHCLVTGKT